MPDNPPSLEDTVTEERDLSHLDWHEPARESASLFGLSEDDVEAIVRNPINVVTDPSTVVREWHTERRQRGDVTVVVTYPEDHDPLIWGVYLNLDLPVGKQHAGGGGGASVAPRTLSNLRKRIVTAGLTITSGGRHDLVHDSEGNLVATLPRTPSDHRTVPNVWVQIRKKGYDV